MPKMKISVRAIEALQPASAPVFLWDSEKAGFGVKVTPAGKKVFILQYRLGGRGSKTMRYTIGPYGVWTVATAEKEAGRLLLLVGQGVDPGKEKQNSRRLAEGTDFDKIADLYLKEQVMPHTPRSYDWVESVLRVHIRPVFKGKALSHITEDDIRDLIAGLPLAQTALRRNVFAALRPFFKWAKTEKRVIKSNPMADMDAPPTAASRDRVLDDAEMKLVWRAASVLPYPFGPYIRLLLALGQRRTELAMMDWKELNRDEGEWIIPGAKTKNGQTHVVPLSTLAVTELDMIAGCDAWPKRGLVFTTTGKTGISGFSRAKRIIDAKIAELVASDAAEVSDDIHVFDPWRFHDLRRSMATGMQRLRIPTEVIEACENRLAGGSKQGAARVYQRYAYADEKRAALEKWGDHLTLVTTNNGSNVVPLALKAK